MLFKFAIIHNSIWLACLLKNSRFQMFFLFDINLFNIFFYESFLLLVSKNLVTCVYVFPNSHEIAIRPTIPKIIVIADIPASLGP